MTTPKMLLISFVCVLVSACTDGKTHKYPSAIGDNFVKGCMKSGDTKELCMCYFGKVQAKYTLDEFTALDKKMKQGERPQDFIDFAISAKAECGN